MAYASILFGEEALTVQPGSFQGLHTPCVYSGQRLRGVVRKSRDDEHDDSFDAVQLFLKGEIRSTITPGGKGWMIKKPVCELIRMSCVREKEDFKSMVDDAACTNYFQTNFFFDIPSTITLPSSQDIDSKSPGQPLPPTIGVHKKPSEWLVGKPAGRCDVIYYIQARFLKDGQITSRCQREIILMPVAEMPPPMNTEDLTSEYILSASTIFGSFWKRKKCAILYARSYEPQPIVMHAILGRGIIPTTNLTFDLSMRTIADSTHDYLLSKPRFTTCEVTITLEATTYFQEHEQLSALSRAELQKSQVVVLKTSRFPPQVRKMSLEDWHVVDQISAGSKLLTEWNTTKSIQALIPRDTPRLPSFSHPMISRRHAFDVQIKFGTDIGTSSQKPMRLKVPVQLIHGEPEKGGEGLQVENYEEDMRVPAYVSYS